MANVVRILNDNDEEIGQIYEGDRIVRKKSIEFLKDTITWKTKDPFIKMFPESLRVVALNSSGTELAIIMSLVECIDYDTGMLSSHKGFPITNIDIEDITGFNKKTIIVAMDNIVCNKIFSRNKVGRSYQYFANPFIFMKGKRITTTLHAMFKNYKI
jgi:hypothetical protein